jgi:hypothetical protein
LILLKVVFLGQSHLTSISQMQTAMRLSVIVGKKTNVRERCRIEFGTPGMLL